MEKLNYQTLEKLGYQGYLLKTAPERVLQFGEGNFLRAFADYFIDVMNEKAGFSSKVVLVQPSSDKADRADAVNGQEGLYTLYLRGYENGKKVNEKRVISCVSRCLNINRDYEAVISCADNPELRYIVCNTTEAGIVYHPGCNFKDTPPQTYPAKLTQFLYRRFQRFGKEEGKGFLILPCELIDDNGKELKKCVLNYALQWELGEEFMDWLEKENVFCSTLVDRIVTGYPQKEAVALHEENGYEDHFIDAGEIYSSWIIQAPEWIGKELPFEKAGLPVRIVEDYTPYRERKVRILNGAHTAMALGAYLSGKKIVRECMEDKVILEFVKKMLYDEIIPTLSLPKDDLRRFADAVIERFQNPFIDHELLAISLNSTSKWRTRVLPSLKDYLGKYGMLPKCMTASFAFYIAFYRGISLTEAGLIGERAGGELYAVIDERTVLEFYYRRKDASEEELVHAVCANTDFWGADLADIPGFEEEVVKVLKGIKKDGSCKTMFFGL